MSVPLAELREFVEEMIDEAGDYTAWSVDNAQLAQQIVCVVAESVLAAPDAESPVEKMLARLKAMAAGHDEAFQWGWREGDRDEEAFSMEGVIDLRRIAEEMAKLVEEEER